MRRLLAFILIIMIGLLVCPFSDASGFSSDVDEIETATKSVLKLTVYGKLNKYVPESTGSGFVAFNSSTLITNYHVIEDAFSIEASDDDDNVFLLNHVLCADEHYDIAILEFSEPTNLKPLDLYADDQLKRGSPVVAIGSPKGLKNTVSTGIVSSQFDTEGIPEIQITAPISPGSSGGALFNDDGKVIGVTSASYKSRDIFGQDTGAQNLNFAINISVAQAMYQAWDGTKYSLDRCPNSAKMDFTGVYNQSLSSVKKHDDAPWICSNCGQENTSKFCKNCGAEKPFWVCVCGEINSGNSFCGECGRNIADLIDTLNNVVDMAHMHNYVDAIDLLVSLGAFNCGSYETKAGREIESQTYLSKLYYDYGLYIQSIDGEHDLIIDCFTKAGDYEDAKKQLQDENDRYYKAFYDAGEQYLANDEYDAAIESFKKAGEYSDAAERIQKIHYELGEKALAEGDWDTASAEFSAAGNYQDASERVQKAHYSLGEKALAEERWTDASAEFAAAGNYQDAAERVQKAHYDLAEKALAESRWADASAEFIAAGSYLDAITRANETYYKEAESLLSSGEYDAAIAAFEKLGDYNDSAKRILKIHYDLAEKALEEQRWDDASTEFATAADYENAKDRIYEPYYLAAETFYNAGDYNGAIEFYEKAENYDDATGRIQEIKSERAAKGLVEGRFEDAIGAHVFFGHYEQDGNNKNGPEEIEWIILDAKDNTALLISQFILDAAEYNKSKGEISWEKSSLRKWLNKDFINKAFDKDVQIIILPTNAANKNGIKIDQANLEKVFLIDDSEVQQFYPVQDDRRCIASQSVRNKVKKNTNNNKNAWWVRSSSASAEKNSQVQYINSSGGVSYGNPNQKLGVRPAIRIDLKSYMDYVFQTKGSISYEYFLPLNNPITEFEQDNDLHLVNGAKIILPWPLVLLKNPSGSGGSYGTIKKGESVKIIDCLSYDNYALVQLSNGKQGYIYTKTLR